MRSCTVCVLAVVAVAVLPSLVAASDKVNCMKNAKAPVEWLGLDNLSGFDIKVRTCAYDKCSGDPSAPNAYYDCTSELTEGSHNTTWLFNNDVKSLVFVFKSAGAPSPLGYQLAGDASHTLAVTKDAVFRECETDTDCPQNTFCQNGAGKTPPFFCHGPSVSLARQ